MKTQSKILFLLLSIIFFQCKEDADTDTDPKKNFEAFVIDADGNQYKAVVIGDQNWMAENLRTTKYNDGTDIPLVTSDATWTANYKNNNTDPMMCWVDNDPEKGMLYGGLYNGYVVNTGKLCPEGWHIPTEEEWKTLTDYVGENAGIELVNKIYWSRFENLESDKYGFNALFVGYRENFWGKFMDFDRFTFIWSSTTDLPATSNYRFQLINGNNGFSYDYSHNSYGLSCRCIQD